ncbi:MAG: FG-GAP repeat protein, partial [Myxococcota bacterium]
MNRRRLVALAVTGFLGCTGDFEVADTPDQGLRDQAEDRADADETGADEGMPDERVADQRIVDMAPSETGVDRGVSDAAADVALDLEVAPCGVDERVAMNRCVPCTGGEGRRAGDDPRGPDTMCEPDACTEPFGISCTRFETAYLKGDTLTESAFFGTAVALDGDTLVVGAPGEGWGGRGVNAEQSGSAPNSGAVYVFRRTVEGWQQEAYIKADNADENDFFGFAIALDGDTLVVGAPYESGRFTFDPDNNEDPAAGAAYIYERRSSPDGPRWQQDAYLKSSLPVDGFFHGWDVDISGDTVVVGTPGSSRRAGRGSG